MRHVDFHHLETRGVRTPRGGGEFAADARHVVARHFARRAFAFGKG